ncbi:MAG: TIGR03617 family F420-dependent LLM class oxidoreductase [Pseudomonadales bacterium]|jgi:probable F420-dependent oxidoreductase|nr:TIGR03617 family F420-dependent LLM class oxidoreductase [Pseudomonadales bacterium]MDP7144217.1 TIGR03617 family F420-dependent LLM class oxidoreductase [Pseudomonadales bacterium]MDP7358848.1 TIGR03617 family F420-dependent LLM class oxidoreductase [Pseudomonadales bacterium]MDP7594372.1 TIGR03617 family F420-dependent LLM class oxidoreductase [Pseudomonadales bacterium]HJN49073.1 TIGR03617 family F420-dependent LLM class oxidoreductase [Pseudomonadales bacterium]|tara:strand:+ start:8229 stop:9233 length:1005 start_codon:yes stop_codon:yes gene_type:complete
MKVDAGISADMAKVADDAMRLEAMGYDGIRIAELNHDAFLPLVLAAEHTESIELVTSVAVAFSRNPMSLATIAHDLNAFSGGRLVLGLGSQVRPHIERRFSMPWYKGARQMREFIDAMQAIFDCWYDGDRLDYVGEYYQHTLMPATFTPDNIEAGRPRIMLSATGPLMTKVAAEVADGMIMHPFSSEQYMREVTLPAIEAGLAKSKRTLADFELDYAPIVASGNDEESIEAAIAAARDRIAFYGSTEAYRPVLELHGWGDLQSELNMLNKRQQQRQMADVISDEILHTIAIIGTPEEVVDTMKARFGDVIGRTSFRVPSLKDEEQAELLQRLRT